MITLNVEDYCQNCTHFEPVNHCIYTDSDIFDTEVLCQYASMCNSIYAHIWLHIQKEKNND